VAFRAKSLFFPLELFLFIELDKVLGLDFVAFLIFGRAGDFSFNSPAIDYGLDDSSKKDRSFPQIRGHPGQVDGDIIA
jgi:hypothetical protein